MANWVQTFLASNPDLAAKPIASRGQRHIAHDNGDGTRTWNFTGAPIHYHDGTEWKPIDTKLIYYPDTDEYGAAGLKTRIKSDGSARIIDEKIATVHAQKSVEVGTYNQATGVFTIQKTLPAGTVVDDSIVRTVGNFTHKLTLTETGLREHLVLNSALAVSVPNNIWLVIKTELASVQLFPDGWLGDTTIKGYQFPKPHGWDGNNKELPLKRYARFADGKQYVYTGILGSSLTGVTYPVTIDPDYLDSTNDGQIYGSNVTYSIARTTSEGFNSSQNESAIGQCLNGGFYSNMRLSLKFDTSGIPDADTVTQVNLKLVCNGDYSTAQDFDVQIVKQDWSAQDPLSDVNREVAYDACLAGTLDDNIWRNTLDMAINTQYSSGNLNTAWVSKTGSTYYSLRSSRDYAGNIPTGFNEIIYIVLQEHATVAYRPILTVVSSGGGSVIPVFMANYRQQRS